MAKDVHKTLAKLKEQGIEINLGTDKLPRLNFIPSGSLLLDAEMGTQGFPCPKFIHIYGEASSGKSALALSSAGYVTRSGFGVILIDAENNFDCEELAVWRKNFGIVDEHLIQISGKQDAQKILDTTSKLLEQHPDYFRLVIIDSLSALTSFQTQDKEMKDGHIDDNPRIATRFLRVLNSRNKSVAVLLIAHTMTNIGSLSPKPEVKGGRAPKFFSVLRLNVSGKPITESRNAQGFYEQHLINVVVEKNKIATPGGAARNLVFKMNEGCFDIEDELITLAIKRGVITMNGTTWLNVGGEKFTRKTLKELLLTSKEHAEWLFFSTVGCTLEEYFTVV